MNQIVHPRSVNGVIKAPPSKSITQRIFAAGLLHSGKTIVTNVGESEDEWAAMEIIKTLGAKVERTVDGKIIIVGNPHFELGNSFSHEAFSLNCNESGLSLRMFTPIAASSSLVITINGSGSLLRRPIAFFEEMFPLLGVNIVSNEGKLPITVSGPLIPADIDIDGSISSQFLTGMLFAFAHNTKQKVCINVSNLKSAPYIDLTIGVLNSFGYDVQHKNYKRFYVNPVAQLEKTIEYEIEGDWSGASFMLVAGAIAGKVELNGLSVFSKQADKAILAALQMADVQLSISDTSIQASKPFGNRSLKPFHFDANHCPDLFPPLSALAAYCDGISLIEGVNRLTHKESNRAHSLKEAFDNLGVKVELQDDMMLIYGGLGVAGGKVHSYKDHRIAMACSILGLQAHSPVCIEDANVVSKSYPGFYNDLDSIAVK